MCETDVRNRWMCDTSRPYSNQHGTLGGTNSFHDAIRVGDTVFDNVRPNGVPFADFAADMGGFDFLRSTGAKISETVF